MKLVQISNVVRRILSGARSDKDCLNNNSINNTLLCHLSINKLVSESGIKGD